MKELCNALVSAYPTLNWFAFGEAKRLAADVHAAVTGYRKDGEANRDKLVDVGNRVMTFLSGSGTEEANRHYHAIWVVLEKHGCRNGVAA